MKQIKVIYAAFPKETQGNVFGFTFENKSSFVVMIDSTQSTERQKKTLKHEVAHIILGHFEQEDRPIQDIETEASEKAATMTDADLEMILSKAAA